MSDEVDRMLHDDAQREVPGSPPPSFDRLMSEAMTRGRRDRRLTPWALAASVVAFACLVGLPYLILGRSHPVAQAPATTRVPWSGGSAASTGPSPSLLPEAPLGLPVCDDSAFTGSVSSSPAASGGVQFGVVLTSTASERCMMPSGVNGPTVSLFDASGRQLATGTNKLLYAGKGVLAVRPGQVVTFTATWDQWCGSATVTGKATLKIWLGRQSSGALRSGKKLPAYVDAVPTCRADIARDSDLFASGFGIFDPGTLGTLTAALDAPRSVASGSFLHAKVDLSNHSTVAVGLTPCPAFVQKLQDSTGNVTATEVSALNCSAAPKIIRPGDVVELELQFRIPAAIAGKYYLFWHWRDTPCCDDAVGTAILVTPS